MAVHPVHRIRFAVEQHAPVRRDLDRPQAERLGHGIDHPPVAMQAHRRGVQVGILPTLPEMRVRDADGLIDCRGLTDRDRNIRLACRGDLTAGIGDFDLDLHVGDGLESVGDERAHLDRGRVGGELLDGKINATRCIIQRTDADGIGHDQCSRPIDPAAHREIGGKWGHVLKMRVVGADADHIGRTGPQERGEFVAERAERAAVLADMPVVEIDVGDDRHRFEPHEDAPACSVRWQLKLPLVPTGAAIIAIRQTRIGRGAVLAVEVVPSVGQRHSLPLRIDGGSEAGVAADESPVGVQRDRLPLGREGA